MAATFVGLLLIPVDFGYRLFAVLIAPQRHRVGHVRRRRTRRTIMNARTGRRQRGAAAGMRGTFFNAGSSLSIGVFFSLMIVGLAATLPSTLTSRADRRRAWRRTSPSRSASLPPVGSLFAAFLGYNPVAELLGPTGALQTPARGQAATLTGKQFFPQLISEPFHHGLVVVFVAAAVMMLIAAIASFATGREEKATV